MPVDLRRHEEPCWRLRLGQHQLPVPSAAAVWYGGCRAATVGRPPAAGRAEDLGGHGRQPAAGPGGLYSAAGPLGAHRHTALPAAARHSAAG